MRYTIKATVLTAVVTIAMASVTSTATAASARSTTRIAINHPAVHVGSAAVISGSVSPNLHGHVVYLQTYSRSTWVTVLHTALSSTSRYAFTVHPHTVGKFPYRVYDPPASGVSKSLSPTVTLTTVPPACTAHMSNARPTQHSTTHVLVTTRASAAVTASAHYKTTTTTHSGTANAAGHADIPFDIANATHGYRVIVDVSVRSRTDAGTCSTSFTTR